MNVLNALENCAHPLFPIGVVAERLGVSDHTLRLYEVKGLVKPASWLRRMRSFQGTIRGGE